MLEILKATSRKLRVLERLCRISGRQNYFKIQNIGIEVSGCQKTRLTFKGFLMISLMRTTLTFLGFPKTPDLFHIIFLATQVRQLATFCWINCKKEFPILRLERALRESLFRKFAADRKSEGGVIVSGSASSSELSRLYCSVEVFCNKRYFHWIKYFQSYQNSLENPLSIKY